MAKEVVSIEGNLRNYGITAAELAEEREPLDAARMAEMLYSGFEEKVAGVNLPPATDMNGYPIAGTGGYPGGVPQQGFRQNGAMPASSSERAIAAMMDVRDDMVKRYASVAQEPMMAKTMLSSIRKVEAEIIGMGGDIDRFDPDKFKSGLSRAVASVDPKEAAKKVVENTKQSYTLRKIESIFNGANKNGVQGVCIKIACNSGMIVHGTVVPKRGAFSGSEAIDFVPDDGKGTMSVKSPNRDGYWDDVSEDYDIRWQLQNP